MDNTPIEIVKLWTEIGPGGHRRTWVALKKPLPPVYDPRKRA
jgi:hypothetical protein